MQTNTQIFIPRLKSFGWRLGGLIAVSVLAFVLQNLGLFNLSVGEIAILTLVINEVTKWINDKIALGKAVQAGFQR